MLDTGLGLLTYERIGKRRVISRLFKTSITVKKKTLFNLRNQHVSDHDSSNDTFLHLPVVSSLLSFRLAGGGVAAAVIPPLIGYSKASEREREGRAVEAF